MRRKAKQILREEIGFPHEYKDQSIVYDDINRIDYYSFLGVSYAWICSKLGSYALSQQEYRVCLFVGALTPLFDDFYDSAALDGKQVKEIIELPEAFDPATDKERLIGILYGKTIGLLGGKDRIVATYKDVWRGQEESRRQRAKGMLTYRQLMEITYLKGGASFVFVRGLLWPQLTEKERYALYRMGGLLQLESDVFDLWRDFTEGIATIPLLVRDWTYFRKKYVREVEKIVGLFLKLDYPQRGKSQFIMLLKLVYARGLVCVDQYEALQKKDGNKFFVEKYSRKDLICDMEKPRNILKMFRYAQGFPN